MITLSIMVYRVQFMSTVRVSIHGNEPIQFKTSKTNSKNVSLVGPTKSEKVKSKCTRGENISCKSSTTVDELKSNLFSGSLTTKQIYIDTYVGDNLKSDVLTESNNVSVSSKYGTGNVSATDRLILFGSVPTHVNP